MEELLRLKAELGPPPPSRAWVSAELYERLRRDIPTPLANALSPGLCGMQLLISDCPWAERDFNAETDIVVERSEPAPGSPR